MEELKPELKSCGNEERDIKKKFHALVMNNLETMQKDLDALKPNERIKAVMDMVKYILPSGCSPDADEPEVSGFEKRIRELLKNNS